MADATVSPDVIARSFVPEGTPRATALTPEQQQNQEVANRLRQKLEATAEDPLASLKMVEERKPLAVDLDTQLKRRFGTEGTPLSPEEQTRFNQAKELGDTAKALAESGFESLTDVQKNTLTDSLVAGTLDKRPAFQGLADEEVDAIATEMLKNPDYQKKVGELLANGLSPDEAIEASRNFAEAQRVFDEAAQAFNNKRQEAHTTLVDRFAVERQLDEFKPIGAAGTKGAKLDELETLRVDEPTNRTDIIDATDNLKLSGKTDADIELMKTQVAEKISKGEAITDPDEMMVQDMLDLQKEIDRIGDLEIEWADLELEKDRLNQRLLDIPDEMSELQHTRDEKENELLAARGQKMLQEQSVIENLRRVAPNAGNEILDAEIQKRAAEYQNQLKEMLDQAKDVDEQRLIKRMQSRWDRSERKGDSIRFTIKKGQVNTDMRTLLVGDGPEAILKEMLTEGITDAQEIAGIEERIKTDKDFVKKYADKIASTILTKKLQSGRLYEGEIRVMVDRPWGEGAINQAIANDNKKRELIEKIHGSDSGSPSYVERIKRAAGNNWLKVLMLLLVGGVGAGGVITSQLVKQEGGSS